jgi:hypothetical protein
VRDPGRRGYLRVLGSCVAAGIVLAAVVAAVVAEFPSDSGYFSRLGRVFTVLTAPCAGAALIFGVFWFFPSRYTLKGDQLTEVRMGGVVDTIPVAHITEITWATTRFFTGVQIASIDLKFTLTVRDETRPPLMSLGQSLTRLNLSEDTVHDIEARLALGLPATIQKETQPSGSPYPAETSDVAAHPDGPEHEGLLSLPFTIRLDRRWHEPAALIPLGLLLLSLGLTARSGDEVIPVVWVGGMIGGLSIIAVALLRYRRSLLVDQAGLVVTNTLRRHRIRWSDLNGVDVITQNWGNEEGPDSSLLFSRASELRSIRAEVPHRTESDNKELVDLAARLLAIKARVSTATQSFSNKRDLGSVDDDKELPGSDRPCSPTSPQDEP